VAQQARIADVADEPLELMGPITGVMKCVRLSLMDAAAASGVEDIDAHAFMASKAGAQLAAADPHGLDADEAGALWLYEKAIILHKRPERLRHERGESPNAAHGAAASTCSRLQPRQVRIQFYIPLSVLLGQGRRMADVRIQPMHKHSHKNVMIDYSSGASGLQWAVDAATMLENFHSYAMALYRIGAAETAGAAVGRAAGGAGHPQA
jgi:hypothetical protein